MGNSSKLNLTTGSPVKKIFKLSYPIIISNLMHVVYNMADTAWLGILGKEEVAAMAFAFPIVFFVVSLGMGVGIAGSIFVSQYEGAGKKEKVNYVAAQTLSITFILAVIVSILGYIFSPFLVELLGAEPAVAVLTVSYLKVIFPGLVFMFSFFIFNALMRGWGDTVTPMKIMVVSNLVNIIVDPILIFGIGPIPRMGITGAALATVLSRLLASIVGVYILFKGKQSLSLKLENLKPDWKMGKKIFKLGWPATLEHSMRSIGFMILTSLVATFGTVYVAAYSIGTRVFSLFIMPSLAVSMGVVAGVGQSLGAGLEKRAREITLRMSGFMVLIIGIIAAFFFLGSENIVKIFLRSGDSETLKAAALFLRRLAYTAPFVSGAITMRGGFKGAGRTFHSLILGFAGLWIVRIPLSYLWAGRINSAVGIWNSFIVAGIVELLLTIIYYRYVHWSEVVIEEEKLKEEIISTEFEKEDGAFRT
ncbi:MAG: MATE family efflux transporter [Elusimicrobiota bacterium]